MYFIFIIKILYIPTSTSSTCVYTLQCLMIENPLTLNGIKGFFWIKNKGLM